MSIGIAAAQGGAPAGGGRGGAAQAPPPLKMTSPDITDGSKLADKFACAAGNDAVSPALQWSQAPRDTMTFALVVHDMEGHPRKGTDDILHWMVWNLAATSTGIPQGISAGSADLPDGSHQTNGFAAPAGGGQGGQGGGQAAQAPPNLGYRPPCPPQNVPVAHHYSFELFALDTRLDLPATATRADVMKAMDGHVSGHASIVVPYNR